MAIERRPIRDLKRGSCYLVVKLCGTPFYGHLRVSWYRMGPQFVGEETLSPIGVETRGIQHFITCNMIVNVFRG